MRIKRSANDVEPWENESRENKTWEPCAHVVPEHNARFFQRGVVPQPCNDPGLPPAGRAGEATVLLVCTGLSDNGLSLDVVLETSRSSTVIASKVSERDAIAEARRIGALHGAHLAMLSLSGHRVSLEPAPLPFARRYGSPLSGRRPRFLTRRKPGFDLTACRSVELASDAVEGEQAAEHQPGEKQESGVAI
jgi:hypothetical protein